jgi:hypothetical protein
MAAVEEGSLERVPLAPVDRVEVLSLMDNSMDTLLSSTAIAPAVLVPQHCTGWRAHHALSRALPGAYCPNSISTCWTLAAEPALGAVN